MNKYVGLGLIASAVLGLIGTAFASNYELSNGLYTIAGYGLYIFGVWAAVILLRQK